MTAGALSVESLLKDLKREGALDSTGVFTLDLSQARDKLAQFQLSDPFQYALKLVQAAVAAQADAFQWQSGSRQVVATMRGVSFAKEDLLNAVYCLLGKDESVSPALRHLAMAINAAVGTRASEIILRSWDGHNGCAVHWSSSGSQLKEWRPESNARKTVQTRFEMTRILSDQVGELYKTVAKRDLFGMLKGNRQEMDHEQSLIYDWCSFSPIAITINGQPAPGYELGVPGHGERQLLGSRLANFWGWISGSAPEFDHRYHLFEIYHPSTYELGIAPPRVSHSRVRRSFSPQETYSTITALPLGFQAPLRLIPVLDGVLLPVISFDWSGPGALLYVSARQLDVDLTSLAVVRNRRTLRVVQSLARELLDACEDFLKEKQAPGLSPKVRSELGAALAAGRGREVQFG